MKKPLLTILCLFLAVPALAESQRLAVKVSVANIRSGPGEQYDALWQVGMYHPLRIIEKKGGWYRFRDFEKDEGWVHRSLVAELDTVITINEKCNIRSGPSTRQAVAFTAEKGVPFKVLERRKDWIRVAHADGDQGWIHKSLVW